MGNTKTHSATEADVRSGVEGERGRESPADGTDPLAQVVAEVQRRREEFVDRAVQRMMDTVDRHQATDVVDREESWWAVYGNLDVVLLVLGERRELDEDELAVPRELGRRWALQGVPIDEVTASFRVGYTVLWEALGESANRLGSSFAEVLLEQAGQVWMTFDQVTSAVTEAHREVLIAQYMDRRRRALGLLSGLRRYPEGARETDQLARSLNVDPQGPFTVAVQTADDRPPATGRELLSIDQADRVVVLSMCSGEPSRTEVTLAGLLRRRQARHIGVGIMRQGLGGARQSLEDAEGAFCAAVALDEPAVFFRSEWLACLAMRHADQLSVLVAPAVQALENDDDLRATLHAFLEADGSPTAAAKALCVHANTIAYRLRQFAQRTGIDPRTAPGQSLTQVALTYSRNGGRARAGAATMLSEPEIDLSAPNDTRLPRPETALR